MTDFAMAAGIALVSLLLGLMLGRMVGYQEARQDMAEEAKRLRDTGAEEHLS